MELQQNGKRKDRQKKLELIGIRLSDVYKILQLTNKQNYGDTIW